MTTRVHLSLSVRGALNWTAAETRSALAWMTRDDGTPYATPSELRDALMDQLAAGVELIPMTGCDNHDPRDGCRGHEEAD